MKKQNGNVAVALLIVILIIVLIVGVGVFYYVIYPKLSGKETATTTAVNEINSIQEPIIQNTISNNNTAKTNNETITAKSLVGTYGLDGKEGKIELVFCENGTYGYYYNNELDDHYFGYYTIEDNIITLHHIISYGNDVTATIVNKDETLTINPDNSITDYKRQFTFKKISSNVYLEVNLGQIILFSHQNDYLSFSN